MTRTAHFAQTVELHETAILGMTFYGALAAVRAEPRFVGSLSVIERAWRELGLAGVLFQDGRPVLYLKTASQPFDPEVRAHLHKLFWNQGTANVLVLADPATVYIYSGLAGPVAEPAADGAHPALVEQLPLAEYLSRVQSFYLSLGSGLYYEEHRENFVPEHAVDEYLLANLGDLRNALISGPDRLEVKAAHGLLGRLLFLCYLLDRGIVPIGQPGGEREGTSQLYELLAGQSDSEGIAYLYQLFEGLKIQFNGNMFDQDLAAERKLVKPVHIRVLIEFLGAHDVGRGQRTLGFWPYDFKMIPVEMISAIYQDFLGAEDAAGQREGGAFYTPRFLAELTVDLALQDEPEAAAWSFLDPACGSGMFLVMLFNRLAHQWLRSQPEPPGYVAKANALQGILRERLRGIDIAETACRITCFSLYLAYLDFFDPPDILAYAERTERPLPKLLVRAGALDAESADIPVVYQGSFLAGDVLPGETFDCIIGNPPWAGRQNKQLAHRFADQARQFLRPGGTGCLLLPSKMFFNRTDKFQARWLREVTLDRLAVLADFSFLLFQDALCPAVIARFTNERPALAQHRIEFISPKFSRTGLRRGVIAVNPADRCWLPLADVLAAAHSTEAPMYWKRRLWGTRRDQKLLEYLLSMPPMQRMVQLYKGKPSKGNDSAKRWVAGQGFKPWSADQPHDKADRPLKPIAWPLDTPFISATHWHSDLVLMQRETIRLEERLRKSNKSTQVLYSQPPDDLFKGPLVLISQGFTKIAFCEFDVLFQHSLQSISGPEQDRELLMFLAAYLRSGLARYFLFHTSANWGTERDKVHLYELLRLPFPLPGDESAPSDAARIVAEVANKIGGLRALPHRGPEQRAHEAALFPDMASPAARTDWNQWRKNQADAVQREVEPLIYRYFGITEQEIVLVEDTLRVSEPSSTPTTWEAKTTVTLDPITLTEVAPYASKGLKPYADALTAALNSWAQAEGSVHRVYAEGGIDEQTGMAMVTLRLGTAAQPYKQTALPAETGGMLARLEQTAAARGGIWEYKRDVVLFDGEQIHIVRPYLLGHWTRTAALNDAANIFAEIVLAEENRR